MNERFWIAGVSLAGTSHLASGKPCEDAHFTGVNDEGSFVLVACDGAGSRRFSRLGANAVAPAVGKLLLANVREVMARELRPEVVTAVAISTLEGLSSAQRGTSPSDFACTLVALLVHEGHAMTCHVGDGAIFCLEGEHPRCISPPDRDPGGGPFTRFVTCKGVRPRMWTYPVPDYWTGFLCVTDGAEPGLYNSVTGACTSLVTSVLNRFDLGDRREEQESSLRDIVRSQLQPRSEDDITVVGARRAFAAGIHCPECKRPAVEQRLNRAGTLYFGKCRACHHMAFAHDENLEQMQRGYLAELRRAGFSAKEIALRTGGLGSEALSRRST